MNNIEVFATLTGAVIGAIPGFITAYIRQRLTDL